jgi:hypothetical protein
MTALVLDHLAALPALARSVRGLLSRLGNGIDQAVSVLAARKIPECRLREVQNEIARYHKIIRRGSIAPQN